MTKIKSPELELQRPFALDHEGQINSKNGQEIRKIAEEFESLFLGIVLKSMRDSVQDSGLFSKSNATKIYTSMLDDEYAKIMAANRHTGIAESIENFLKVQNQTLGDKAYKNPISTIK